MIAKAKLGRSRDHNRGRGLVIRWGFHPTRFGEALIAVSDRGICGLSFVAPGGRSAALEHLRQEWRGTGLREDPQGTAEAIGRIFAEGPRSRVPPSLHLRGTNFQIRVWKALIRIPQGSVASYEQIARLVGNERAARAVGAAVGRNPIAFVIPCHRVVRKSGGIGDYRWGPRRKRMILAWEAAHAEKPRSEPA